MRAKQKALHMMNRKAYAQLEEDMKNQSQDPNSISRVDVWIKGHARQKEKPVNEALQEAMVIRHVTRLSDDCLEISFVDQPLCLPKRFRKKSSG
ncbi:unnamed protein product [Camellia sinensis]